MKTKLLVASLMAGAVGFAAPANAVVISLAGTTAVSGGLQFSYDGTLADNEGVTDGSQLVIFDFAGYVDGSISAGGLPNITATAEKTTGTVPILGFTDNPDLYNLVFTYHGPTLDLPNLAFTGLSAVSTFGAGSSGNFSAITFKPDGTSGTVFSIGPVGLPSAVPEPTSWALMIGGMGLVGMSMRTRRNRRTAFVAA